MRTPLQITFRGMAPSEALRDVVERRLEKMAFLLDACTSCRVVFDREPGNRRTGSTINARIELHGMSHGSKVFVQANHVDAASAAREAFDRAQRKAAHAPIEASRRARAHAEERSGLHAIVHNGSRTLH